MTGPALLAGTDVVVPLRTHPWDQDDVAAFLKCDVKTVQRLEAGGAFFAVPIATQAGRRPLKRYDEAAIRAWWAEQVDAARAAWERTRAGQPPVRVAGRLAQRAVRLGERQRAA